MSDTNNNIPTRITQLEEATEYEDGMFFAVAKAGRGTYKIPVDEMTPNEQALSDKIENEIVPAVENSFAYGTVDESEIASFSDGSELPLKVLEVAVNPVQDLHGYDSPWPAGGGKNKSEKKITEFSYSNNAGGSSSVSGDILTVTTTSTNNSGVYSYLSFVESFTGKCSYSVDVKASTSASALIGMTNAGRKSVNLTTEWQRVKFEDVTFDGQEKIFCIYSQGTANTIQLKDFMFETGSTAHDYEPYENDCPIIGWTECKPTVDGKNKFDIDAEHSTESESYLYNFTVKPNTAYTLSSNVPFGSPSSLYFNGGASNINGVGLGTPRTFTSDANGHLFVYVRFVASGGAIDLYTAVKNGQYYIQLEEGTTATTYEPYNFDTYIVQLGDTYYLCKLDVVSGLLTVLGTSVDLGTLNWALESGIFRLNQSIGAKLTTDTSAVANMLCSIYKTVSQSAMGSESVDKVVAGLNWSNGVRIKDTNYTSASDFKTAMNGVQLVYELATPVEVQLTPTQVKSLKGYNNISADTGNILKVEYIRDLDIVINSLLERIAALEG